MFQAVFKIKQKAQNQTILRLSFICRWWSLPRTKQSPTRALLAAMKKTSRNGMSKAANDRKIKRIYLTATVVAAAFVMAMPAFADDPLTTINNLSDFVFSAIKAIGAILLGFGIVQIGLALKGHDASQRAQGFMTFFGGVVIYFAKDILDMIL